MATAIFEIWTPGIGAGLRTSALSLALRPRAHAAQSGGVGLPARGSATRSQAL
jgi:hypothetical protein